MPLFAFSSTSVDRSVATISKRQPESSLPISLRPIASAAHQMRTHRLDVRAASIAGTTVSRKCSNGVLSRKNSDSFVVIASTTSMVSASASALFSLATSPLRLDKPFLREIGSNRLSTR